MKNNNVEVIDNLPKEALSEFEKAVRNAKVRYKYVKSYFTKKDRFVAGHWRNYSEKENYTYRNKKAIEVRKKRKEEYLELKYKEIFTKLEINTVVTVPWKYSCEELDVIDKVAEKCGMMIDDNWEEGREYYKLNKGDYEKS